MGIDDSDPFPDDRVRDSAATRLDDSKLHHDKLAIRIMPGVVRENPKGGAVFP